MLGKSIVPMLGGGMSTPERMPEKTPDQTTPDRWRFLAMPVSRSTAAPVPTIRR
jgi:hypothetical protein